jgi:hypothetical protein
MRYELLFIEIFPLSIVTGHVMDIIVAVFLFHFRPNVVVMSGFLLIVVSTMVVGVVILSHVMHLVRASCSAVTSPGEGVALESWRLYMPFPPSFLFELYGLKNWVILLLGLCHSFLGRSPVHL